MPLTRVFTRTARSRIGTAILSIFSCGMLFACPRDGTHVADDPAERALIELSDPDAGIPAPDASDRNPNPPPVDPDPTIPQPSSPVTPNAGTPDASSALEPDAGTPDASSPVDPDAGLPAAPDPNAPVDCADVDWSNAAYFDAPNQRASALWAVMKSEHELCVWVEGEALDNYVLYLDTDADASTGYTPSEWPDHGGADYSITRDGAQQLLPDGTSQPISAVVNVSRSSSALMFELDLDAFSLRSQAELWLGFELIDPGSGVEYSSLPAASFARVTIDAAAPTLDPGFTPHGLNPRPASCPEPSVATPPRGNLPIGRGIIIPAYIGIAEPLVDDTLESCTTAAAKLPLPSAGCMWLRIREGAKKVAAANPKPDYWVVANGPDSGPLLPSQWKTAGTVWDPIRDAGGLIFGYVHTNEEVTGNSDVMKLRSLETVTSEIQAWVQGYGRLDGIWLDEYNPRFELFGVDGQDQNGKARDPLPFPVGFPNSLCYAPTSRDFMPNATYNPSIQIAPAGGYYQTLTQWIKDNYPALRIIGNAGGRLYTNQKQYGGQLVHVLASIERSYAVASADNWSGFPDADPAVGAYQLAMIHSAVSTATDAAARTQAEAGFLAASLQKASAQHYTHVYVGYRQPDLPGAPPAKYPRVWGIIPPFFEDEITSITNW
jgi:hypothetical protein